MFVFFFRRWREENRNPNFALNFGERVINANADLDRHHASLLLADKAWTIGQKQA